MKKKLCSRKFWVAVVGLIVGIVLLIKGETTVEAVAIMATSVAGYLLSEGAADVAAITKQKEEEKDE